MITARIKRTNSKTNPISLKYENGAAGGEQNPITKIMPVMNADTFIKRRL